MIWSDYLYVGAEAEKEKSHIVKNIKRYKYQSDVFVLCLADVPGNIMDIYPSHVLNQKYYKNKKDIFVLGIAKSYDEAMIVMEKIIMDCYEQTGGFELDKFAKGL